MDPYAKVNTSLDGGAYLIDVLREHGFEIEVAFWAKLTEDRNWLLYVACPGVDECGTRDAIRTIHEAVRGMPALGIDPFEIRAIGVRDPMAVAAAEVVKPKVPTGRFADANPKWFTGPIRYTDLYLGGMSIDGAYIYPPKQPAPAA